MLLLSLLRFIQLVQRALESVFLVRLMAKLIAKECIGVCYTPYKPPQVIYLAQVKGQNEILHLNQNSLKQFLSTVNVP